MTFLTKAIYYLPMPWKTDKPKVTAFAVFGADDVVRLANIRAYVDRYSTKHATARPQAAAFSR